MSISGLRRQGIYIPLELDHMVLVGDVVCYRMDNGGLYDGEAWGVKGKRWDELSDEPSEEFGGLSLRGVELRRRRMIEEVASGRIKDLDSYRQAVDDDRVLMRILGSGNFHEITKGVMAGKYDMSLVKGEYRETLLARANAISALAKLELGEKWPEVFKLLCEVALEGKKISEQQERFIRDLQTVILTPSLVEKKRHGEDDGLQGLMAEWYGSGGGKVAIVKGRKKS